MQQSIGPYRVQGEIGRGGMGVVYRALDSRLDREVAIKALPEDLAADPLRLERFEREARALAQVSHPNIAGIYGVEEQAGHRYLVLEFVDGETLADKLDRGPVEFDEAIELACQIAAGVGAAHDAGVVHRDLKPANIRITPDGVAKVLDFGLARQEESKSSSAAGTHPASPATPHAAGNDATATTPLHHHSPTIAGAILGTAAYMSPEQARGRRVDKRTDIWSFGVILYEMLTGASPFVGETATDSIGAVLHKSADLTRVPANVRHILDRCLERDKEKRFRDIGDVAIELRDALKGGHAAAGASKTTLVAVALVTAILAGAAGLALGWFAKSPAPARHVRLSIAAPPRFNLVNPTLSPAGTTLVYGAVPADGVGTGIGYIRRLDELEALKVPGATGGRNPAFSPSGDWLSFMSPLAEGSSELRLVKFAVGKDLSPVPIAVLPDSAAISGYNGLWLTEEKLVFADGRANQIRFVSASTGTVSDPIKLDLAGYEGTFEMLLSRADDTRALCRLFRYTSSGYQQDIGLLDTAAARINLLLENSAIAAIGPDGSLLFSRGSTLYGATLDLAGRKVGPPVQLVGGLRTIGPYQDAFFGVSRDGTLCFLPGGDQGSKRRLEIRLPDGTAKPLPIEPRPFEEAIVCSPDESRLLVVVCAPGKLFEIWGTELESPRLRRIRGVPSSDLNYPVFAGDNDTFVYMRSEGDKTGIEAASFDGKFEPYWVIEPATGFVAPQTMHPTRNTIVCQAERPEGIRLFKTELKKGSQLTPLFSDPSNKEGADFSPDGSMLSYLSDETGRSDVYVCAVREDGSLGRPVAVTNSGALGAHWESPAPHPSGGAAKPTSRLILGTREAVLAYDITPGERPRMGTAEALGYDRRNMIGNLDQISGGRRLCMARGENEAPSTHAELILNWYDTASRMIRGR